MAYDMHASKISWEQHGDGCTVVQDGIKIDSVKQKPKPKWFNNILEANGTTPLSKINKITKEKSLKCNVYMKLEYFNVGGSLEDRAAIRMIEVVANCGRAEWIEEGRHCDRASQRQQRCRYRSRLRRQGIQVILCYS
ncbi:hypothetical protein ANCCAN_25105 [Ancylostoma caninum]|uniref:Tryptophan synthase beta chain-like PALP domain-containing protein n=1 Tax=Ancylostoma caninum TaxID=29170 RepID=A0A368FDQ7_ANCCA|nr:hypothetical protein ANCCAN_25105 [Ancylostoma caninum]